MSTEEETKVATPPPAAEEAAEAKPEKPVVAPREGGRRSSRARTKPTQLTYDTSSSDDQPLQVPGGAGTPLGEIENVNKRLGATKAVDPLLKKIHGVLYPGQKMGVKTNIKARIRQFKGFEKGHEDAAADVAEAKMQKFEASKHLKPMCLFFDLEVSGTKEKLVDRIVEYLKKPESSGKEYRKKGSQKRKKDGSTTASRPLSGYFVFTRENRPQVKEENPDMKITEMSKILGAMWGELDDDEKAAYKQQGIDEFEGSAPKKAKKAKKASKKKKAKKVESSDEETEESSDEEESLAAQKLWTDMEAKIREIMKGADLDSLSRKKITNELKESFDSDAVDGKKKEIKELINAVVAAM